MLLLTTNWPLALEGGQLGEAIIVFLGLLAYLLPTIIRKIQGKDAEDAEGGDGLPGRRGRSPRGGGEFVGEARRDRAPKQKTAREVWRELLSGEEPPRPRPEERRGGAPPVARRPRPAASQQAPPQPRADVPPVLTELGHSIDELHQALEEQHAEMEEIHHAELPSESTVSTLVPRGHANLPSEEDHETTGGDRSLAEELSRPTPRFHTARPGQRRAWRRAVVLTELFGAPIALREPTQQPGRLPR